MTEWSYEVITEYKGLIRGEQRVNQGPSWVIVLVGYYGVTEFDCGRLESHGDDW